MSCNFDIFNICLLMVANEIKVVDEMLSSVRLYVL